nr:LuxR C-terminal-related transcriptional regulator [uncultured Roseateles sp.]
MNEQLDSVSELSASQGTPMGQRISWAQYQHGLQAPQMHSAKVGVSASAFLRQADLYEEIQRALLQVFSETLARVAQPETLDAMLVQTLRNQAALQGDQLPSATPLPSPAQTVAPPPQPTDALESLSPRELEVLQRLAAGESNKLIARAFDLSPHTVKRHVANILNKLGASSRGQAAAWLRARP